MRVKSLAPVLLVFVLGLLWPLAGLAGPGATELRVHGVDASQFPLVRARLAVLRADGSAYPGLTADAVQVLENGRARPVESVAEVEVGVQVVFIIDAAVSTMRPGLTSKLQRDEAIEAIDMVVTTADYLDPAKRLDHAMLIMPLGTEDYEVRQAWTTDYVRIHNAAYEYDYAKQTSYSALHAMLVAAIGQMSGVPGHEQRAKFVVVFSDGIDRTSAEQATDVIARAQAAGVTVMTVGLGGQSGWTTSNLNRMARLTGGLFTLYKGPDSVLPVYEALRSQRLQQEVAFRSAIAQTGKHVLRLQATVDGVTLSSGDVEMGLTVQPPAIAITSPPSGTTIRRTGQGVNPDPLTLEPRALPIAVNVSWPDGHPRGLVQGSYVVDGVALDAFQPGEALSWDISALSAGPHALQLEVKDELGLVGRSDPLQIEVILPPTFKVDWVAAAALVVGLIAVGLGIYILVARPRVVVEAGRQAFEKVNETVLAVRRRFGQTRPTMDRGGARAYLVDVQGRRYAITSRQVKVGRSAQYADLVVDHPTISRQHALILEEADGVYRLCHDGGQGGTYVNEQEVGINGVVLQPGDKIGLGDADFTFQVGGIEPLPDDATTPAQRTSPEGSLGYDQDATAVSRRARR